MANSKNFQIVDLTSKRQIIARGRGFYRLFGTLIEENPLYGTGGTNHSPIYHQQYISHPILGPDWFVCKDSDFGDVVGHEGDFVPCADYAIMRLLDRQAESGCVYIYGALRDAEDAGLHILDSNPKTGPYDHRICIDLMYYNKQEIHITNGKHDQYYIPPYEFRASRTQEAVTEIASYVKQYCDFFKKTRLCVKVKTHGKMPASVPEDLLNFEEAVNKKIEQLLKED